MTKLFEQAVAKVLTLSDEEQDAIALQLMAMADAGGIVELDDDTRKAILGMLPDCDLAHVRSAGNAAGTGARIALLDSKSRDVIEALVRRIEKVETAIEPRFQQHFVEAMAIPHKSAPYTNLRKVVTLPPPKESTSQSETRGRRPRRAEPAKPA